MPGNFSRNLSLAQLLEVAARAEACNLTLGASHHGGTSRGADMTHPAARRGAARGLFLAGSGRHADGGGGGAENAGCHLESGEARYTTGVFQTDRSPPNLSSLDLRRRR